VAHQQLYTNGWQNQDYPECCCRDCHHSLAAQGIWSFYLPEGHKYIAAISFSILTFFDVKELSGSTNRHNSKIRQTADCRHAPGKFP